MNRNTARASAGMEGRYRVLTIAALAATLAVVGCAQRIAKSVPMTQRDQSVSQRIVLPEGKPTYKAENDQKFVLPHPYPDNPLPAYPKLSPGMMPLTSDVMIMVTLVIDENGRVVDIRSADDNTNGPRAIFLAQVRSACENWKFTPLQARTTKVLPDGEVFGQPKVKVVTEVKDLPFSLDYEFVFSERTLVRSVQKGELRK